MTVAQARRASGKGTSVLQAPRNKPELAAFSDNRSGLSRFVPRMSSLMSTLPLQADKWNGWARFSLAPLAVLRSAPLVD
jgi:hypothetical protein